MNDKPGVSSLFVKLASPFSVLLLFQTITTVIILLDFPIAREILGFIFLIIFPGYILVQLLGLNHLDLLETILFSVGLSIFYLMFSGLLINELCLFLGISAPLSLLPLLLLTDLFVGIGGYLLNKKNRLVMPSLNFKFEWRFIFSAIIFIFLPLISIIGTFYVNVFQNNLVLLFLIGVIGLVFALSVFSKKFLPEQLYPFALFMIALAIIYHTSLISTYVWGGDIHIEYFTLDNVLHGGHWNASLQYIGAVGRLNSMLSITILPAFFSNILGLDINQIFKMLYPVFAALVSLVLFQFWKKNIGSQKAFMATFFFISMSTFYGELLTSTRQIFGELFVILLFFLITTQQKSVSRSEILLFSFFSFGLIVSHYALAEIFLGFMIIIFIILRIFKRPIKTITANRILLFSTMMFVWYIYTSGAATFDSFTEFGTYLFNQIGSFFDPSSRGSSVLIGLGLSESPSIWNTISRIFAYLTEFLIILGFISVALKRSRCSLERVFLVMSFIGLFFLIALIVVPGLANTLNMSRFYHILLLFLAPYCILGGYFFARLLSKHKSDRLASILIVIVLVGYFLFQSGFVYAVVGNENWSVPVGKEQMKPLTLYRTYAYVNSWKVAGASWLGSNFDLQKTPVYAEVSAFELRSYGLLELSIDLTNTTQTAPNGIVYLSSLSVIYGIVVAPSYSFNSSQLSYTQDMNALYSNGQCEIFYNSG